MAHIDRTLNYLEMQVTDVAAAKAFYGSVFDWGFTDYEPQYSSFSASEASDGGFARTDVPIRGGAILPVLYATDLEATRDRIASAGGTITKPIFTFPGGRRFHFTDPSGNELAVWSE